MQAGQSGWLSYPVSSWDETQVFTFTKKRKGSVLVEELCITANVHGHKHMGVGGRGGKGGQFVMSP